jgi:RNA polymerase sigma factor (sigma-70 family)
MIGTTSTKQNVKTAMLPIEKHIAQIAAGDKNSLAELYGETKTAVYGFALSILKNVSDAEDVLQDTYLKLWSSAESYSPMGKPMAWILTITKNLATSRLRERGKSADIPEDEWLLFQADSPSVSSDDRIVLSAAMKTLTEEERQIVMLYAVSGLKHKEIADLMSLPLSTVLSKYSRSLKKLKNTLKEGK